MPAFDNEEQPTQPARPTPEQLATHAWLAEVERGLEGPPKSATNRWRAVAVAAVEGGAARVSVVDAEEATAPESEPEAEAAAPPDSVELLPALEVGPALGPLPSVDVALGPTEDLGPSGTVRIARAIDEEPEPTSAPKLPARLRGPTGTVKIERPRVVRRPIDRRRSSPTFVLPVRRTGARAVIAFFAASTCAAFLLLATARSDDPPPAPTEPAVVQPAPAIPPSLPIDPALIAPVSTVAPAATATTPAAPTSSKHALPHAKPVSSSSIF